MESEGLPKMELLPQLTLVADNEGASKRAGISLAGKILSKKKFKGNEILMVARRIWFTKEPPKVEEIGQNLFLFTFKSETDRNRVWQRRPWTIKKAHLVLREWKTDIALDDIMFDTTTFWIQIKALPLQFMTKTNAEMIGNLFNKMLQFESYTRTNILGTKYLRMQVEVEINKPIPVGFFHNMGKKGRWISFQYERLPDICYRCGILGHVERNCPASETSNIRILGDLYGPWLKTEAEAALLVRDGERLRRVENKKSEHFDNFSDDINTDISNVVEEEKIISEEEETAGEVFEKEDTVPNPGYLQKSTFLSNQATLSNQGSTGSRDGLPTDRGGVEGLKNFTEEELTHPLQAEISEKETIVEFADKLRKVRKETDINLSVKDRSRRGPQVGQKRALEAVEKSPVLNASQIQKAHILSQSGEEESGPRQLRSESPLGKKIKTSLVDAGPLIKCDNFPNSSISPHLKLKTVARMKGNSPSAENVGSVLGISQDVAGNICMAEEAGLSTPPNQP